MEGVPDISDLQVQAPQKIKGTKRSSIFKANESIIDLTESTRSDEYAEQAFKLQKEIKEWSKLLKEKILSVGAFKSRLISTDGIELDVDHQAFINATPDYAKFVNEREKFHDDYIFYLQTQTVLAKEKDETRKMLQQCIDKKTNDIINENIYKI